MGADGVLVPGGFGDRGIEGMILAVQRARTTKIPFLGICLGMQVAVIEWCRSKLNLAGANSTEFDKASPHPVVIEMPEISDQVNKGGNYALWAAARPPLRPMTMAAALYKGAVADERQPPPLTRSNPKYIDAIQKQRPPLFRPIRRPHGNLRTPTHLHPTHANSCTPTAAPPRQTHAAARSCTSRRVIHRRRHGNGKCAGCRQVVMQSRGLRRSRRMMLMGRGALDLIRHPFFMGVQFHPELLTRPLHPSPPFYGFIAAAAACATEREKRRPKIEIRRVAQPLNAQSQDY